MKIIDEDGLFSLINAAPAPDAPLEEVTPPASISAGTVSPGPASAPSTSGRRMPASFSGRAAPSAPAAAPSSSHAGVCQAGRESIICHRHWLRVVSSQDPDHVELQSASTIATS